MSFDFLIWERLSFASALLSLWPKVVKGSSGTERHSRKKAEETDVPVIHICLSSALIDLIVISQMWLLAQVLLGFSDGNVHMAHTWQSNWIPLKWFLFLWASRLTIGIRWSHIKTAHEIGLKLLLNNTVSGHDSTSSTHQVKMGQYAHCLQICSLQLTVYCTALLLFAFIEHGGFVFWLTVFVRDWSNS